LRELVPTTSAAILHVDFVREKGEELFELACGRDLGDADDRRGHSFMALYVAPDEVGARFEYVRPTWTAPKITHVTAASTLPWQSAARR
jgi:hypothetical protein